MVKQAEPEVVVVGSANLDLALTVERAPITGETLVGGDLLEGPGGKGLNQAVASARLGRHTTFVGSVGNDPAGDMLVKALEREAVSVRVIRSDRPTGRAVVLTDATGDSTIVISPGANASMTSERVHEAADVIAEARAVLVQHEIPAGGVDAVARLARGVFVLNPAPGRLMSPETLSRVDLLVPNRHELAVLTGGSVPGSADEAGEAAVRLGLKATVVVTLGERGAVVVSDRHSTHVEAVPTDVIDATGAGDTFCAALVDAMLDSADPVEAARWAAKAAAITVSRMGAAASLPRRAEMFAL